MRFTHAIFFAAAATLAGCAFGPTPQTAQQFREGVAKGGFGTLQETYQVDGPYTAVVARVEKKGAECFNKVITLRTCINNSCQDTDYTFIPRFTSGRNGAELVVQVKLNPDHNTYLGGPPPKNGMFVAVADITPIASNRANIAMYGASMGMFKYIPKAVKHWAQGSNLGCPDFTADM